VSAVSLKLKYASAAFLAVVLGAVFVVALLAWQHRADNQQQGDVANTYARQAVARELQARAQASARYVADAAAAALASSDPSSLGHRLQPFLDDRTVAAITVRDTSGATLFDWHAPLSTKPTLQRQAVEPVRTMVESIPGAATPKTLGEVRVQLLQAAPERSGALTDLLSDAHSAQFLKNPLSGRGAGGPRRMGGGGIRLARGTPHRAAARSAHQKCRPNCTGRLHAAA
jgi:hypothetical protein